MLRTAFRGFPKEALQFLRSLKRNNNREWFQEHKTIYELSVKKPMEEYIAAMSAVFSRIAPEMIATPKVSAFRIYRDTRFSKDKSPYKTHIAAVFPSRGLEKHEGAAFYVQIDPNRLLIGGGVYRPAPDTLRAIRIHIRDNYQRFESIVNSATFRRLFGLPEGDQLSRTPRGFDKEHPGASYFRMKQFLAGRDFSAEVATNPLFEKRATETFVAMLPFIRFLNEPIHASAQLRKRQSALLR